MRLFYYFIFTLASVLFSFDSIAGKAEKGLEQLKQYNFNAAKELFYKGLKRERVGSSYGLSLLYGQVQTPFFNLDSAYLYILEAETLLPKESDKERVALSEYGVSDSSISIQKHHVSDLVYQGISASTDIQLFLAFIENHPWSRKIDSAIMIRNELAFGLAMDTNTYQAYNRFIKRYPEADELPLAKARYDELFFLSETSEGTAEAFQRFSREFPDSPYRKSAQKKVFELSVPDQSVEQLSVFVKQNPENHLIGTAWKNLYAASIVNFEILEIQEFLLDYPDYPFREEVQEDIRRAQTTFYPAKKHDVMGYVDSTGSWLVEPCYEWVSEFVEGKAVVYSNGYAGYINKRGEEVAPCSYEDAFAFSDGAAVVEGESGFGAIDFLGKDIINLAHDEMGLFSNGLVYASIGGKYGYYTAKGELLIPFKFKSAFDFNGTVAKVETEGGYGLIDASGSFVVDPAFKSLTLLDDSVVVVENDSAFGMIHLNGDTLLPITYSFVGLHQQNRLLVVDGEKYGYANKLGELVIEPSLEMQPSTLNYAAFQNGYAKYKVNEKFGIIDSLGNRVYPAIFEDVGAFSNTLTAVKKRGMWGFADTNVNLKLKYRYSFASSFENNIAVIEKEQNQGVISTDGAYILEPQYKSIEKVEGYDYLIATTDTTSALFTASGDTLISGEVSKITRVANDALLIDYKNSSGLYDLKRRKFFYLEEESVLKPTSAH